MAGSFVLVTPLPKRGGRFANAKSPTPSSAALTAEERFGLFTNIMDRAGRLSRWLSTMKLSIGFAYSMSLEQMDVK